MKKKCEVAMELVRIARLLVAGQDKFVSAFELDNYDEFQWDDQTRTVTIPFIELNVDRDIVYEELQDWQGYVSANVFGQALKQNISEIVRNALFGPMSGISTNCTARRIEDYFESSGKIYLFDVKFKNLSDAELDIMNDYL